MSRPIRVAIDGPAGAGKSTVAKKLADRLGFLLVDTGALYRAVALAASRAGLAFDEEDAVTALAERLVAERAIEMQRPREGETTVRLVLRGEDVSLAIRSPAMSLGASRVSAVPGVRAALLSLQRQAGERTSVVLEGRDIGTVVFPDAEVKFFLTAPVEVRAKRRHDELAARGEPVSLDVTADEVRARDRADTERPVAPLRRADDAVLVDSAALGVDEVVDAMAQLVLRRSREG
jgi:cytidylate kinase